MKIICGTDFSSESAEVATIAAHIANSGNVPGSVSLLHAFQSKSGKAAATKAEEARHARAEKQLAAGAKRLRKLGAETSAHLIPGVPDEVILGMQAEQEFELALLAAFSGPEPGESTMGRTSLSMLEHSAVPMLFVRRPRPLQDWLAGKRPLRILCAFDFTVSARRALAWVPRLAKRQPCEIIVVHVADIAAHADDFGLQQHDHNNPDATTPAALLEAEVARRVDPVFGGLEYRILISDHLGSPATRLLHLGDREEADLIIVGSHQLTRGERALSGSMSLELTKEASQSVLVVPLSAPAPEEHLAPIERVLIATDLSAQCNSAARRALAMVPVGAEVSLITVLHPRQLPNREFVRHVADPRFMAEHADWIERSRQALSALVPGGAEESRVRVEVVEDEDVAEGIRRAANRIDASLVCLGTVGRTGLTAFVLGSVAQDVLKITKRPIMLIPPEEP
ncbi:MAG: universal stress protein [Burkholderiaceae bacterium]|nr:universal stress protein [Burkholderiaceae bacterium]